ncbi:transcriptional modulator of MazE/toxin, MazF [Niallia circulans]|uniref:type II toxin-antitoxin system PemK/MazF family toxin n=1 Tax=Shouchella clausii TaxID=79880 RepID=UPI000D9C0C06|nr:type II toxin-antitoxin system PemK/MazF family toxin [Shouchella clausii]MCM3550964.1 type II toxin-antitoxin system PemK/MazF family toxin [Shouchella clausii]SPU21027.1 transcriptional modulator of MazE/toxin, MazF [Niallia circulans]
MTSRIPEKGDLAFLDFNPQSGVEQAGHRPCLVLTPSSFNQATGLAGVCPIRTRSHDWPFEVELPKDLAIEGYVLTDQLKSLDWKTRNLKVKDRAPEHVMQECFDKIHTFL